MATPDLTNTCISTADDVKAAISCYSNHSSSCNTVDLSPSVNDTITAGLSSVKERITSTFKNYCSIGSLDKRQEPRLVAVTKTKPVEMILRAYQLGQRHFGENYVQELVERSNHPLLVGLDDICWHFIGHLQRNKCNSLTAVPHLWAVETVDSDRLATTLDTNWKKQRVKQKLQVFIQVNTSGEDSKHGCQKDTAHELVKHVLETCTNLEFCGLMTIGQIGHNYSVGPNLDFECLAETRRDVCKRLGIEESKVELSMGMSADFEQAIMAGSTNVRVGSTIFGAREYKK